MEMLTALIVRITRIGFYKEDTVRNIEQPLSPSRINMAKQYEYQGKFWSVADIAKHEGISKKAVHNRMSRGWTIERMFSPTRKEYFCGANLPASKGLVNDLHDGFCWDRPEDSFVYYNHPHACVAL